MTAEPRVLASEGSPLSLVRVVRRRVSKWSPDWPSVKFREPIPLDNVMIRAGPDCTVSAGVTHASSVIALDFLIAC